MNPDFVCPILVSLLLCCVFWPANACLHMHAHGRKQWKTLENHEKSTFSIMRTRSSSLTWAFRTHDGKGTFSMIFKCFSSFLTMQTHAQACISWLKYTTLLTHRFCFNLWRAMGLYFKDYVKIYSNSKTILEIWIPFTIYLITGII